MKRINGNCSFVITEYEDKATKENKTNENQNEQNKQKIKKNNSNEPQKNLLIDLTNDVKPKENSWVGKRN